jgi:hypothetical protein
MIYENNDTSFAHCMARELQLPPLFDRREDCIVTGNNKMSAIIEQRLRNQPRESSNCRRSLGYVSLPLFRIEINMEDQDKVDTSNLLSYFLTP